MNFILFCGALLGFLSVGLGAYIDHVVKLTLDAKTLSMLQTALHYQLTHAMIISAIGLSINTVTQTSVRRLLAFAGGLFIIGTCLFSFSLYFAGILGVHIAMKLTPTGGTCLLLAWITLASAAIVYKKR